jgi:ribosomal protein L7/L12
MNKQAVMNMIMAARLTGRTNRDVFDMLTDEEIAAVLDAFTTPAALSQPTRAVWLHECHTIDRKIDCIKTARNLGIATGEHLSTIGLKEAKDFVEGYACLMLTDAQIRTFEGYLRSNFPRTWLHY